MKKWMLSLLIIAFSYSCKKEKKTDPPSPLVNYRAILAGSNEVPSNTSTATGQAIGTFNNDTKILSLTITFTNLSATHTAWHIHKAAAGTNGPVVFNFGTPQPSGFVFTSAALTADQEADLKANLYYVNIHTSGFPGGEIRGQLNTY